MCIRDRYKEALKSKFLDNEEIMPYWERPQMIPFFNNNLHKISVKQISCGDDFSIAVARSGQVFGWGDNTYGQLALDNNTSSYIYQSESGNQFYSYQPVEIKWVQTSKQSLVGTQEDVKISKVIWGSQHAYAMTEESKIFFWGLSKHGLNLKPNTMVERKPLHLHGLDAKRFEVLATYENHTLALGHCIELTFSHPSMPRTEFTFLGIPNDYSVMDINFFKIDSEEIFIINDFDLPYAVLKHKKKRGRMTKRNKLKLLLKLAKKDLDFVVEDDKNSDESEEESEEE